MTGIDQQLITGLILAGGRGTRMGQVDKGLQNFRGAPMALHALMRLSPQVGEIIINANQNLAVYESFGTQVWPDQIEGFAGPLAGVQTGLQHCETPYMLTVPCDSPLLPENLCACLSSALLNDDADLALAVTLEQEYGITRRQTHPVFALMKSSILPSLTDFLQQGGRKVDAWFQHLRITEVVFEDSNGFRNINTLQELRQFEC
ncbi:molybdenum cofactor guanylyltransferase MobA [Undibacterium oligocarboniphilum]|uniref:Molybdenum cofactor guanylyltransferase n=1 Tax=Undibacterium oligocarboniphilum TaxID=666702 RepID=A0A850QKK2_9BURK|nr:molybdenum cofactor guanylyltransferase MobA [Undibacterium oligocarboniphilum]MBC3870074.1 molybdenum cofactor guanylyltransferase MobA [Undibacterium oligocarboniphilum]NVO78065.1 molybdenum cofactor guanylyltransferase MobA [Undibacterium oligocarboniphilum]